MRDDSVGRGRGHQRDDRQDPLDYAPEANFPYATGVGGLGVSTNRGLAISNGHIFLVTLDDKLQAMTQTTGEEL